MDWLSWIIVGLLGGLLGKLLVPGKDPGGCFLTIIIGIVGGIIGNLIAVKVLHWAPTSGIDLRSIGISAAGSIILLLIYRLLRKK